MLEEQLDRKKTTADDNQIAGDTGSALIVPSHPTSLHSGFVLILYLFSNNRHHLASEATPALKGRTMG